jgi:hypothetical protein
VARIDLQLLTIESGTESPRGFSLSELRRVSLIFVIRWYI